MKSLLIVLLFSSILDANLKYNHYSKEYEVAHPNSVLKYNHYTKKYTFEHPNAELKYNPYSKEYYFPQYN